jgi:hypothetical protein
VQVDVPATGDPAVLAMVHRLDTGRIQVTVLNFSDRAVTDRIVSGHLPVGVPVVDMFTDTVVAEVDGDHACTVSLRPYEAVSLHVG